MNSTPLRTILLLVALGIVIVSVLFTNHLANRLAEEEHKKIEIWAEATRQFILADEYTDINFVSSIIEGNTTIPVYMVDSVDNVLLSRNVNVPKQNVEKFYKNKINELKKMQEPIIVKIEDNHVQYIYYDESTLLKQLHYFPYIQFAIISIFVFFCLYVLYASQKSEQDRVWVGLTKETAHQLGTPISSLLAWQHLLQDKYPNDVLLPEMDKDIKRLQVIADRFSKIGSEPSLEKTNLVALVQDTLAYMQKRTSNKVEYKFIAPNYQLSIVNGQLFSWVLENLCKNAVDAMEGKGTITVTLTEQDKKLLLDIADTGKGIPSRLQKRVFEPGFTTKNRGWGLGLSLAKRIIEEYHHGKIFVKESAPIGTTFRIVLPS